MYATQRQLSLAALTENATQAAWKTKPSWYLVSQHDNAIPPDAERFMAKRMGAVTEGIDGSTPRSSPSPCVSRASSGRSWPADQSDFTADSTQSPGLTADLDSWRSRH